MELHLDGRATRAELQYSSDELAGPRHDTFSRVIDECLAATGDAERTDDWRAAIMALTEDECAVEDGVLWALSYYLWEPARILGRFAVAAASAVAPPLPFPTLIEPPERVAAAEKRVQAELMRDIFRPPFLRRPFRPEWRTETAVARARGVHELHAFDRLPMVADSLKDAGCDDAELLAHLRSPGPHVRGCWEVDTVLGRR